MTAQVKSALDQAVPIQARQRAGQLAYHAGDAAEGIALRDYQRRGLHLAARRWRGSRGEIDLILRDGAALVFVEVKKSRSFGRAADSLGQAQMQRIYAAASEFLAGEPAGQLTEVRFDAALVDAQGSLRIIENAFGHF